MDKKRLKVALVVLNAVKTKYPETKQFIDSSKSKKLAQRKHFLFCSKYVKSCIRLNSFGFNIYLRVV